MARKSHYLGTLAEFIDNRHTRYPEVMDNDAELHQDLFQVKKEEGKEKDFCLLCPDVDGCVVCPVNAAYSTDSIGSLSSRICELKKIQRDAQTSFHEQLQSLRTG